MLFFGLPVDPQDLGLDIIRDLSVSHWGGKDKKNKLPRELIKTSDQIGGAI